MAGQVLIVVDTDGTVDFCSLGEAQVVLVDYRTAHASSFPDEVDALVKEVKALDRDMPWKEQTLTELRIISKATRSTLVDRLPLFPEEAHEDPPPDVG